MKLYRKNRTIQFVKGNQVMDSFTSPIQTNHGVSFPIVTVGLSLKKDAKPSTEKDQRLAGTREQAQSDTVVGQASSEPAETRDSSDA
ncbi:MAG: hypothetical protein AAF989_08615 [Planctomycetota bacterium]